MTPPTDWTWPDELQALARRCFVDEARGALHHELKNRLATLRTGLFVLNKRVAKLGDDEGLAEVSSLLESQIAEAITALDPAAPAVDDLDPTSASPADVIRGLLDAMDTPRVLLIDPGQPDRVGVPAEALSLALLCLLANALEAGDDPVELRVTTVPDARVAIEVANPCTAPPGSERRWLEPFYSSRPGRPGLGLNVAKRVAIQHGGSLTVELVAGRAAGTLLLPAARP